MKVRRGDELAVEGASVCIQPAMGMKQENDDEGFDVMVGACRRILRMMGAWPTVEEESWLLRYHFLFPVFVMLYFCNVGQTTEVVKVWGDFNAVLEVLTTSDMSIAIALFKMLGVRYNQKGKLVVSMQKDWRAVHSDSERKVMWKNTRLSRAMSITIILLAEMTIIVYFALSLLFTIAEARTWNSMEFKHNATRERPMYLRADFIFNIQDKPYYMIFWTFQVLSTIYSSLAFASIDALFGALVLHLCGQLTNLRQQLGTMPKKFEPYGGEQFMKEFCKIVQRHDELHWYSSTIEKSFNVIFLVQLIASCAMLILQGYHLIKILTSSDKLSVLELVFMIYFTLCFTFSIFVYCYVADVLRDVSMSVGDAAYESEWYELTPDKRRLLILVILRTKEPFAITAGKFTSLSLRLFCSVLKSSGSYISMLVAMQDRLIT